MPRHPLFPVLALSLAPACFSPNDQISVDDGGDDTTGSDASTGTASMSASSTNPTTTVDPTDTADTTDPDTTSDPDTTTADTTGGAPVCGDGEVEGDEVCDDGVNDGSYGGCTANCMNLGPHCGDRQTQGDEACDDGNDVNADGCNIDCVESGSVVWTRTLESSGVNGVAVDDEDGVGLITNSAELYRYDADGTPDWDTNYAVPGASATYGAGVAYRGGAGWLFAGRANTAAQSYNMWWLFLDDNGSVLDTQTFDGANHGFDAAAGVTFDGSGNYVVVGSSTASTPNVWVRKFSPAGALLWTQTFDGGDADRGHSVAADADDNIVVVGETAVDGQSSNGWIRKYDSEGGTLWTRTLEGDEPSPDWIEDVAIGANGDIAVVGNLSDDIWVRLYNEDGSALWTQSYDGPAPAAYDAICQFCFTSDYGNGVAIDSTGAVIAAGGHIIGDDADTASSETWVRKYSADGEELWTYTTKPDGVFLVQAAQDVAVDSTDHIILVGNWGSQGWVEKLAP